MEKINKKIIGLIIAIVMILGVLNFVYAENETENNTEESNTNVENTTENSVTNNTNTTANTSNGTTTTTTATQSKKSSNANLSNLGIKPNDFKGFKAAITSYDVTVPADVDSIEIYASLQDSKSSVTGTGKKELRYGENKFEVVVTAEDGTKKTYTLNIKREEYVENTENVQEKYSGDGLASLNINDLELSPKFDTTVYEYTIKYIGEETKLNIDVAATDPYYNIDITGNENLVEGENIINILVSDPDGNYVAVYQITVNKALVDEEAIRKEEEEKRNRTILIIGGIVLALIVLIIIIKKIRKRRNEEFDEEYEDEEDEEYSPYIDLDDEDENEKQSNQLEDFDNDMNYIIEEPELTKEQARKEFLNNYNNDIIEEEIEEEPKKKKHKGKRFK